ncbi:hypothetical protein F5888DRAFT_41188 [Russula emetica]|nr:hypothetical protein F5888DRAFT_41188 [Russula emetica]
MHPRGRSRDVSPVAIARQASEERRRNRTSIMSCYPLPSDSEKHGFGQFYPSPSSPSSSSPGTSPLTLTPPDPVPLCTYPRTRVVRQDTSHAPIDPRESRFSAQIFNPQHLSYSVESRLSSPLPSYPPEKATLQVEAGQHVRDQARAKCRYETLARAEQVFATVFERSRRERIAALLLRARQEDDVKERERVMRELERQEHERDCRRPVTHISHVKRSGFRVLARVPPPVPTSQQRQVPDRFTYTFPFPSTSPTNPAPIRQQSGSMKSRLGLSALTSSNATYTPSVSFDDVRTSMGNALFPTVHGESALGKTRRESELLGTLLEPVRWEDGERWHPGGRVNAWAVPVPETLTGCEACASASLPLDGLSTTFPQTPSSSSGISASTSTSVASRPISWLSFGSRKSTSSVTTAQSTPASAINHSPCASSRLTPQRSCGCTRGQSFVAVDVNDSPLASSVKPLSAMALSAASVNTHQQPARQRPRKISLSARTWFAMHSSVVSVLSAAARFQVAYVSSTAAMLTETDYTQDPPTLMRSSSETVSRYARRLPTGWRASRSDVAKFTSTASHTERDGIPYLILHLVELKSDHRFLPSTPEQLTDILAQDSIPPHSPTSSIVIPPIYQDADRHIFNANPLHLLSRAQINSWRFRGAPGAMPSQVICRPELFYRIEPAGGSLRSANGGSALKWGWRVVWDTDDHGEF